MTLILNLYEIYENMKHKHVTVGGEVGIQGQGYHTTALTDCTAVYWHNFQFYGKPEKKVMISLNDFTIHDLKHKKFLNVLYYYYLHLI